jgi:hypothetical protein
MYESQINSENAFLSLLYVLGWRVKYTISQACEIIQNLMTKYIVK